MVAEKEGATFLWSTLTEEKLKGPRSYFSDLGQVTYLGITGIQMMGLVISIQNNNFSKKVNSLEFNM